MKFSKMMTIASMFLATISTNAMADNLQKFCPGNLPSQIVPDSNQNLKKVLHASGVQIYTCSVSSTGVYSWVFKAPRANLFDSDGILEAIHFAGPTWKSVEDGSSVIGAKVGAAPARNINSVAWLLLQGVSHSGDGDFSKTSFIQRLNTLAGNAPASGCDSAHLGATAQVPYNADYFFYETRIGNPNNYQCK